MPGGGVGVYTLVYTWSRMPANFLSRIIWLSLASTAGTGSSMSPARCAISTRLAPSGASGSRGPPQAASCTSLAPPARGTPSPRRPIARQRRPPRRHPKTRPQQSPVGTPPEGAPREYSESCAAPTRGTLRASVVRDLFDVDALVFVFWTLSDPARATKSCVA
eukprot:4264282-Pyramimonas_sp.AAC.1